MPYQGVLLENGRRTFLVLAPVSVTAAHDLRVASVSKSCMAAIHRIRIFCRLATTLLFTFVWFSIPLSAGSADSLAAIHNRLQDHRRLVEHRAFVFEGEITRLQTIPTPRCKAGVEHKVTYRISKTLWIGPDSYEAPGQIVRSKAFIDCTEKPLPSPPFVAGAKVIVYCEAGTACLAPVTLTRANIARVQAWLNEVQAAEGSPALLQIHERLLQFAALMRQAAPRRPVYPAAPLLFVGKVTSLERMATPYCLVCPRSSMELSVSRILWGNFTGSVVHAWCNSSRCGGATAGETVLMFCGKSSNMFECSSPAPYTDEGLTKVEGWLTEAGLR